MIQMRVLDFKQTYKNGETVDWVLTAPVGEALAQVQTWRRVKGLIPRDVDDEAVSDSLTHRAMVARWAVIGPKYEAWKKGTEVPEDGVPLAAWSGVDAAQVAILRGLGFQTVESVAEMSDSAVKKLPWPNSSKLPDLARKFLAGQDSAALAQQNADLQERIAAMEEMLADRPAKRGRPRKDEAEAAA